MKRVSLFVILLIVVVTVIPGYAKHVIGNFDWFLLPISEYRNDDPYGQIFMNLNTSFNKYHLGEDWNNRDGYDYGDLVYAIGDGTATLVQRTTLKDGYGNVVIISYILPDLTRIFVGYYHLKDVYVELNQNVKKGDVIGTVGDANGQYPPHLHIEVRKEDFAWNTKPYVNPLDIPTANKYTSPSLFVDDRKYHVDLALSSLAWTYLPLYINAPSSTAYVEYAGERYSLKRASEAGLIYRYVYVQINGSWYYYPDITKVLFDAGSTYAIYSFVSNASLVILVPGHHYKEDRAKIDMIRAISGNANFRSVKTETLALATETSDYWHWYVAFTYNNGSGNQIAYVNQVTLKINPLLRYTTYYDPATGRWTPWITVDPNTLY